MGTRKRHRRDAQAASRSPDALYESGSRLGESDLTIAGKSSPRVHLCSLVSAWESSRQIRLALSQGGGEVSFGPGHCLLLKWAITHGVATQNITSLTPAATVFAFSRGKSLLARCILAQFSVPVNQRQRRQKRGRGVGRTHLPCF